MKSLDSVIVKCFFFGWLTIKSGATPAFDFDLILGSLMWYSLHHRRYGKKFPPCICGHPWSSCSALSWWTVLHTCYYFKLLQKGRSFWVKFIYSNHSVYITFCIIMPFRELCLMQFCKLIPINCPPAATPPKGDGLPTFASTSYRFIDIIYSTKNKAIK